MNVEYKHMKRFFQCDRMAADCAIELRKHNVAFISLWPGAVRTELISEMMKTGFSMDTGKISHVSNSHC